MTCSEGEQWQHLARFCPFSGHLAEPNLFGGPGHVRRAIPSGITELNGWYTNNVRGFSARSHVGLYAGGLNGDPHVSRRFSSDVSVVAIS